MVDPTKAKTRDETETNKELERDTRRNKEVCLLLTFPSGMMMRTMKS